MEVLYHRGRARSGATGTACPGNRDGASQSAYRTMFAWSVPPVLWYCPAQRRYRPTGQDAANAEVAMAESLPRRTGDISDGATPGGQAVDLGLLADAAGFALKRAQMAVFQDFIRTVAAEDIRPGQFSVLVLIDRNPGVKQSDASEALGIKPTNFVPLLDGLATRGLIERKPATGDRRSHALHLTERGSALTGRLKLLWSEHEARVRARVNGEDRARLFEALRRLSEFGVTGESPAVGGGDRL